MENYSLARISGVNIPSNKRVVIALTYIYGIGSKIAKDICNKVDLEESKRVNQLSDDEIAKLHPLIWIVIGVTFVKWLDSQIDDE